GAHHAFDFSALSLIAPPNFGSGGGSCLPLIVVVAAGEPSPPLISGLNVDPVSSAAGAGGVAFAATLATGDAFGGATAGASSFRLCEDLLSLSSLQPATNRLNNKTVDQAQAVLTFMNAPFNKAHDKLSETPAIYTRSRGASSG